MAELRSFIFIDQLQPQTLCYLSTWMKGSLPRANCAAQIIEVAPGLDIESPDQYCGKGNRRAQRNSCCRTPVRLSRISLP